MQYTAERKVLIKALNPRLLVHTLVACVLSGLFLQEAHALAKMTIKTNDYQNHRHTDIRIRFPSPVTLRLPSWTHGLIHCAAQVIFSETAFEVV